MAQVDEVGTLGKRRVFVALLVALATVSLGVAGLLSMGSGSFTVEHGAAGTSAVTSPPVSAASETALTQPSLPSGRVVVDVDGAVAHPGVYDLTGSDVRVRDATDAAGGLTEEADSALVNLAAPLSDGSKVYVPRRGEAPSVPLAPDAGNQAAPNGVAPPKGTGSSSDAKVNLNTADEAALETLPGVGEATARAIVEERQSGGPFASVDDLVRVRGIGTKKLEKIRAHAVV